MLSKLLIILTIVLIPCGYAHAQDYQRFRLPEGTRLIVNGVTYQGYTLGEYVELLHMDEDLRYLTQVTAEDVNKINELTVAVAQLQAAQASSTQEIDVLKAERQRLLAMWTQENAARHAAEERGPDLFPWFLAAGFGISTVVLVIALILGA